MALSETEKLARRVEKAEGPSRALDAEICRLLAYAFGARRSDHWFSLYGALVTNDIVPRVTSSLDALQTLLAVALPGWYGDLDVGASYAEDGTFGARLFGPGEKNGRNFAGEGRTPALALTAAMLRAWASKAVSTEDAAS